MCLLGPNFSTGLLGLLLLQLPPLALSELFGGACCEDIGRGLGSVDLGLNAFESSLSSSLPSSALASAPTSSSGLGSSATLFTIGVLGKLLGFGFLEDELSMAETVAGARAAVSVVVVAAAVVVSAAVVVAGLFCIMAVEVFLGCE